MGNVSHERGTENQNTHLMLNKFFRKSCLYEIMVEPDKPQMTIWSMRYECCITKATDTHSEYVILIAFPRQQRLHERASMLRYTYIASLLIPIQSSEHREHATCYTIEKIWLDFRQRQVIFLFQTDTGVTQVLTQRVPVLVARRKADLQCRD
jgi:hypothetical protein